MEAIGKAVHKFFSGDWIEDDGVPHAGDAVVALYLCCAISALRLMTTPLIFRPLGRLMAVHSRGTEWANDNADKLNKFAEQSYKWLFHLAFALIPFFSAFAEREDRLGKCWFYNMDACWLGYPHQHVMDRLLKLYYLSQLAFHAHSLIFHYFEVRRDDFKQMLLHHVATLILIWMSYAHRIVRVGVLIFLVHDLSDVVGCLVKCANYVKWTKTSLALYFSLLIIWFYTRLWLFPRYVIYDVLFEALRLFDPDLILNNKYKIWTLQILLVMLLMLHMFWYYLFLRVGWTFLTKGEQHDFSEESNGEKSEIMRRSQKKLN